MARTVDVVIVGGGVIGAAIAYFLRSNGSAADRVAIVERDPTYRRASSALSASSIRQQFSTPENIALSQFGFEFLQLADEHLAITGPDATPPEVGLVERGYLYLATSEREAALREVHEIQTTRGASIVLLEPEELVARYPWMDVADLALGSLGLRGEGWFDGYALTRAFRRKAESLGATFVVGDVVGMSIDSGRVTGVTLADGSSISCGTVVDAAGPWAAEVAAMAGASLPVEARRRSVFVFDAAVSLADCPLVIDPSGAWFRPEGRGFIGSIAPDDAADLPDLPLDVDRELWESRLWPALATRVPAFDRLRVTGGWAGYYEIDTFDHNAIIGPHPEVTGLLFANGFSGHGLQHAPGVGRAIAELISAGRYATLDLSIFSFERIAAGRPIVERNIIG